MLMLLRTCTFFNSSFALQLRCVHELVDVVDDVRADEHESTEVPAVHAADCDGWAVELCFRQHLRQHACANSKHDDVRNHNLVSIHLHYTDMTN